MRNILIRSIKAESRKKLDKEVNKKQTKKNNNDNNNTNNNFEYIEITNYINT